MFRMMRDIFEGMLELVFLDYWPVSVIMLAALITLIFIVF